MRVVFVVIFSWRLFKSRKFYRDGELNGYVFNYDENERPILIGCYNNNMKNGVFQKMYYEDGNVRKEEKTLTHEKERTILLLVHLEKKQFCKKKRSPLRLSRP